MFSKVFSIPKPLLFSLCFILLAGGAYFFYQQPTAEQVPLKVYKETKPSQRVVAPSERLQESRIDLEPSSPSDVQLQSESDEVLLDSPPSKDWEFPQSDATLPEPKVDPFLPEDETAEVAEKSSEDDEVLFLLEQLEIELTEKYPEFLAFANMSMAEIQEVLSIPGERERIVAMAQEAQAMYFSEIRDLFSALPPDALEESLEGARDYLTPSWGGELTDALIIQLRQEFGL
jgi:hypothetical protein